MCAMVHAMCAALILVAPQVTTGALDRVRVSLFNIVFPPCLVCVCVCVCVCVHACACVRRGIHAVPYCLGARTHVNAMNAHMRMP